MEKPEDTALDLTVITESPQDAEKMEQIINGLLAFADLQLDETTVGMKLLENINIGISVDKNKVRMNVTCPIFSIYPGERGGNVPTTVMVFPSFSFSILSSSSTEPSTPLSGAIKKNFFVFARRTFRQPMGSDL